MEDYFGGIGSLIKGIGSLLWKDWKLIWEGLEAYLERAFEGFEIFLGKDWKLTLEGMFDKHVIKQADPSSIGYRFGSKFLMSL